MGDEVAAIGPPETFLKKKNKGKEGKERKVRKKKKKTKRKRKKEKGKRKRKKEKGKRKKEKRKNERKSLINLSLFGSFRWSSKNTSVVFLRRQRITLVHALQLGNVTIPLRPYVHASL